MILSITLLSVFSCGYMAISRYQMKSVLTERTYMEAQITAKTIHSTFCEAVSSGNSQAINSIWQCFEEDCRMVREEYDEMMDSQEDGGGEGDIPEEAMEEMCIRDRDGGGSDAPALILPLIIPWILCII